MTPEQETPSKKGELAKVSVESYPIRTVTKQAILPEAGPRFVLALIGTFGYFILLGITLVWRESMFQPVIDHVRQNPAGDLCPPCRLTLSTAPHSAALHSNLVSL